MKPVAYSLEEAEDWFADNEGSILCVDGRRRLEVFSAGEASDFFCHLPSPDQQYDSFRQADDDRNRKSII